MFGSNINSFFTAIATGVGNLRFVDVLDILLMTMLIFWLISFMRKMGATQLLRGVIIVLIFFYVLSTIFELTMLNWLLDKLLISGVMFIAILFQPELRKALGHLGRQRQNVVNTASVAGEITDAVMTMSKSYTGALIVIERKQSLEELCDTGVKLDASISTELLQNIFVDKTRLHDGAVVIRNGKIASAACIIPLLNKLPNAIPQRYGTRHRAAVSITVDSDCVALIVSEETGKVSYAMGGVFYPNINQTELIKLVDEIMSGAYEESETINIFEKLINSSLVRHIRHKEHIEKEDGNE